jgi:hypothetical protein
MEAELRHATIIQWDADREARGKRGIFKHKGHEGNEGWLRDGFGSSLPIITSESQNEINPLHNSSNL